MDKQRFFVDMDGTVAVFKEVDTLETLYEEGYFKTLAPIPNVINAVKEIIKNYPNIEVNILSALPSDSKYAATEKDEWLDKYLPEVDKNHRIFTICGEDKKNFIEGGVRETDFLLDDYTKNLTLWQPPARGIKILNGINHSNGTWQHDRIKNTKSSKELAKNIVDIMQHGKQILDDNNKNSERSLTMENEKGMLNLEKINRKVPEATISFYVAECMEFTSLGEYHENINTIEEAINIYNSIPGERANGGKGIGLVIHDNNDDFYNESEYGIFINGHIDTLMTDTWSGSDYFKNNSYIKKAITDLKRYFSIEKFTSNLSRNAVAKMAVLQLGEGEENHYKRFTDFNRLKELPNAESYEIVYLENLDQDTFTLKKSETYLENVFEKFNRLHPNNYYGHSLSVGDVIVFTEDGINFHSHFVDDIGFVKLDAFVNDKIQTRISNSLTIREEYESLNDMYKSDKSSMNTDLKNRFEYLKNEYIDLFEFVDKRKEHEEVDTPIISKKINLKEIDVNYRGDYYPNYEITNSEDRSVLIQKFAIRLDNFIYDYDTYGYWDTIGSDADDRITEQNRLTQDIENGNIRSYSDQIKAMLEDNDNETEIIELNEMLNELEGFSENEPIDINEQIQEKFFISSDSLSNISSDSNIDKILEDLKKGVAGLMTGDRYKRLLDFMGSIHEYSLNNLFLIAAQKPDATVVGSFNFWKKNNRFVIKGEHGIKIIAPVTKNKTVDEPILDKDKNPIKNIDESIKMQTIQKPYISGFKLATVFDLSQTNGEPIPKLIKELSGHSSIAEKLINTITSISKIPIEYGNTASANGYYSPKEQKIVLKEGMSNAQTAKTLIHEFTHSKLHNDLSDYRLNRSSYEIEAESTAYVVSKHFGLDTSEYSFGYITSWANGKGIDEYEKSLNIVKKTSQDIIKSIENVLEKEYTHILQHTKQNISQKIKVAGFKATDNVVNNIIKLDKLLGKEHSIIDLKNLQTADNLLDNREAKNLVNSICNEFKTQEIETKTVDLSNIEPMD